MSKHITKERKGQILALVIILLAVVIGLAWNDIEAAACKTWRPSVSYPMANQNITYMTMLFAGGWE